MTMSASHMGSSRFMTPSLLLCEATDFVRYVTKYAGIANSYTPMQSNLRCGRPPRIQATASTSRRSDVIR